MEKHTEKEKAVSRAKEISKDSEDAFFVVLSGGYYYVDDNGFIRNWEKLICTVRNGKIVK
jgi:hypothetical protein